jgi:glutamate-1-semialdehyde 2,1-aminomutase
VRLARAHAGRPRVLKFEGAYHSANEVGTVSLFPQRRLAFPQGEPTSAGVPAAVADVLVAPYNDLRTTTAILAAHRHEVAAVIVEPLHRCTPPQPGFLAGLRELTAELGVLLIFDETVTGFRLAYGGAQEYYGVRPDLATFGKALGGGYPIGVVAGRADVLDLVREDRLGEDRYVWFASSVGGNAISATAARDLGRAAARRDVPAALRARRIAARRAPLGPEGRRVHGAGPGRRPLAAILFTDHEVVDYRTAFDSDRARARSFLLGLFRRGIFLNPMSTKLYLSLAHTDADIRHFLDAARATLREDCRGD